MHEIRVGQGEPRRASPCYESPHFDAGQMQASESCNLCQLMEQLKSSRTLKLQD
jgi:hypothetical protein